MFEVDKFFVWSRQMLLLLLLLIFTGAPGLRWKRQRQVHSTADKRLELFIIHRAQK